MGCSSSSSTISSSAQKNKTVSTRTSKICYLGHLWRASKFISLLGGGGGKGTSTASFCSEIPSRFPKTPPPLSISAIAAIVLGRRLVWVGHHGGRQSLIRCGGLETGLEVRGEPPLWLDRVQGGPHFHSAKRWTRTSVSSTGHVECGTVINRPDWQEGAI